MTKHNDFAGKYLSDVSESMMCGRKKKTAVLSELKDGVEAFLAENGDANEETLISVFGTPEQIAQSVLQTEDPKKLKNRIALKKAVLIALTAALLIWGIFAVVSLIDVHNEAHGYLEEGMLRIGAVLQGGVPLW